jgi:hypothetical protein
VRALTASRITVEVNAIAMRDHFGGGVSFGGGTRGVGVLCKRAPATLCIHHGVNVLAAWLHLPACNLNLSLPDFGLVFGPGKGIL